jgi:hypothetical protein
MVQKIQKKQEERQEKEGRSNVIKTGIECNGNAIRILTQKKT